MNLNELIQMGAKVFRDSNLSGEAGSNLDVEAVTSALSGLTGGSGGFDFSAVVESLGSSGLGDIAKSWLGDGANQSISPRPDQQCARFHTAFRICFQAGDQYRGSCRGAFRCAPADG